MFSVSHCGVDVDADVSVNELQHWYIIFIMQLFSVLRQYYAELHGPKMARYVVMLHYLISSFGIFILILYCTGNIIDNRERENGATA